MTVDTIGTATQVFAGTVEGVLRRLEARLGELSSAPAEHGFRKGYASFRPDPVEQAKSDAAAAVFLAESVYSASCLRVLSGRGVKPGEARAARTAGDAILRFAACAFRGIVGSTYHSDPRVGKLLAIADLVGDGYGVRPKGGSSSTAPGMAPRVAPRLAPRMSPLG